MRSRGLVRVVGQVGNLRADWQSAQTARVNNPLQDAILPHYLVWVRIAFVDDPNLVIGKEAVASGQLDFRHVARHALGVRHRQGFCIATFEADLFPWHARQLWS